MITAEQLKEAEDRAKALRAAGDPGAAAAEEEFQAMARQNTREAQAEAQKRFIQQLLR